MSTIDRTSLKSEAIDGCVKNGFRQPNLFNFGSDKQPEYKIFCEPETI